jgi:hypothetical protein
MDRQKESERDSIIPEGDVQLMAHSHWTVPRPRVWDRPSQGFLFQKIMTLSVLTNHEKDFEELPIDDLHKYKALKLTTDGGGGGDVGGGQKNNVRTWNSETTTMKVWNSTERNETDIIIVMVII